MKLAKQIIVRVIFLPLIFAAALAVTAISAARLLVKPDDLKTLVTYQFQEILKRPVRIESAKLSRTGEIKIRGLRVTEPGPRAVDFITADYIYARYRLLPLLRRSLEIDHVTLISPTIELIRDKDGFWNFGDLFASYRSGGTAGRGSLDRIARAEIRDGRVFVTDAGAGTRNELESFDLNLSGFRPSGPVSFDLSFLFKLDLVRKPVSGRIYAEGTADFAGFDWLRSRAYDLRADLQVSDKSASFSGSVENFRRPVFALTAQTPGFATSELEAFFPPSWDFRFPSSGWDLSAAFTSPSAASFSLTARPLGVKAQGRFDLKASTGPVYTLTAWAPPLSLGLISGYAALPLDNLTGKVHPRLRLAGGKGSHSLQSAFANFTGTSFTYGPLKAEGVDLSARISAGAAETVLQASDARLTLGKARLTGLKMRTSIKTSEIASEYSGRLDGSPVKGRMAIVNPFANSKTVYFTGWSKEFNFGASRELIYDLIKLKRTPPRRGARAKADLAWVGALKNSIPSGFAFFKLLYKADHFGHEYMEADDFYAAATIRNISGSIEKMKGDLYTRSGRGTLYNVDATSEKDRVFYIFTIPLRLISKMNRLGALKMNTALKDISFGAMGGDYSMDKGRLIIRNFYLTGKEFSASAEGWMDFTSETMELKIYTISGKYYKMGGLPEGLTDASGKPALAFTLKGKIGDPDVKILNARESGARIKAAAERNPGVDFSRLNSLIGGK